jgi:adenine-specific DNA-methyltransferase
MKQAFETIKQLVEDFKNNEKFYLSDKYQESQARQDFIDKFFAALGWDVTHERQKNPYEQEVKIENKVSTQGSQRRADYAFFIAPNFRDVKFYAEAKKPAKNLKDAAFYHQTIRYGWNSGTSIAILTDFEEFHILDCRYKPDVDDALNRKLEYFHYSEYADEEKFKKIFYLFSRETVANGSLEKYAATLPKPRGGGPRGKAIQRGLFKGGYQPVDEAFLEELDTYRETLAKAFKKENPDLGSEELTEAVQRTIDRLVFIRFLEDKQIEDPQMINYSEANSAWKKFSAHCRALEPKYNGLVFKKHRVLDDSGFVPPDDNTFADICNELADPSSPYDFDKIPISILGSIYERFLGKVVHATDKRVKVEEKPEVRKAGGVYYTPQYIVRYIVKETVGKLLYATPTVSTKNVEPTPPYQGGETQDKISSPQRGEVSRRDRGVDNLDSLQGKSPEEIAKMSFADIACGSGSFLIEVYSVLLEYHERYYAAHPEAAKKGDLSTRDGKQVLSLKKRQEILVNNIYGVDIDFQATEVTQLSLYLKLLEEATLNDAVQFSLLKEKLLPDLKNNIICGNSLIGTDIFDGELFAHNISSPSSRKQHGTLENAQGEVSRRDEGVEKLKPMNFEDAFPTVMKRGGFDAVVGNPPYGVEFNIAERKYFQKTYNADKSGKESYVLFIERAVTLLINNGKASYIVPSAWLGSVRFKELREFLLDQTIQQLIVLPFDVFKDAYIDTMVFLVMKGKSSNEDRVGTYTYPKKVKLDGIFLKPDDFCWIGQNLWQKSNEKKYILGSQTVTLLDKLRTNRSTFDQAVEMKRGILFDNSLIKNSKKSQIYVEYFDGDVYRYVVNYSILGWLPFDDSLKERPKELKWFEGKRILLRRLVNRQQRLMASLCSKAFLTNKNLYSILPQHNVDLRFVLGLLNSKLISYLYINQVTQAAKDDFPQVTIRDVLNLPYPLDDEIQQKCLVTLVDQMLKAKEELAAAKLDQDVQRLEHRCATLDRQIDEAVYELYGLTEEEIKIVEGKSS